MGVIKRSLGMLLRVIITVMVRLDVHVDYNIISFEVTPNMVAPGIHRLLTCVHSSSPGLEFISSCSKLMSRCSGSFLLFRRPSLGVQRPSLGVQRQCLGVQRPYIGHQRPDPGVHRPDPGVHRPDPRG